MNGLESYHDGVLKTLKNIDELLNWLMFHVNVTNGSEELYLYFFIGYKSFFSTDVLVLSLEKICNEITNTEPKSSRSPYKFNRFLTFWITRFPNSDWRNKQVLSIILDIAKNSMQSEELSSFRMLCMKDSRRAYARNVNVSPSQKRRSYTFITFGQAEEAEGEKRSTHLLKLLHSRPKTENAPKSTSSLRHHYPNLHKVLATSLQQQKEWRSQSDEHLAQQLTLIDHELYSTVHPEEFLKKSWNSPLRDVLAPNLKVLVKRFNEMSYWVATQVLMTPSPKIQAKIIKKLIRVADKLYDLHNFNGLMQILSGLHNNSILRLKRAWAMLKLPVFDKFKELSSFMSFNQNFQNYREIMNELITTKAKAIPYIVLFMRDITYIEESPDMTADGQMNYSKLMRVGKHLAWFKHFADNTYAFSIDMQVQKVLQDLKTFPEEELHNLSILCEPREDENSNGEKKSLAWEFLRTWTLLPKKEQ